VSEHYVPRPVPSLDERVRSALAYIDSCGENGTADSEPQLCLVLVRLLLAGKVVRETVDGEPGFAVTEALGSVGRGREC
jgi:hypothetical protein